MTALRTSIIALALALVAASCGGQSAEGQSVAADCAPGETDGDLVLYNWSDYIEPSLISQFEAEFGITLAEDFFESNETMQAKISQPGTGVDVIVPSDYMVSILKGEGRLLRLDREALPNLDNLAPEFASDLPFDPRGEFSVPYQWGTTGLAVDTEVVGDDFSRSWDLVFNHEDVGVDGPVSLLDSPRETLGSALRSLGYSVNSTSASELAEAEAVIAAAAIHVFDSDQFEDLLVDGELAVAHGYSGDFFAAFDNADDPDRYEYFVPEEGGVRWVDNLAIPADAPHPCSAHAFINFILDAENGAALTNYTYYGSPNQAAEQFIEAEILEDPAIYPVGEVAENLEFLSDEGIDQDAFSQALAAVKR